MKRLLITMEYPPDVGGVAEYYRGLVDVMPAGSVSVMSPRTHQFFLRWIWPHWLPLLWNTWRVIRREQPDEVWVGQILPIGTVAYLLNEFHVSRFTFHVFTHGMDILMAGRSPRKRALAQRILGAASRIIANSEFTKGELKKLGVSENKIRIVYPCPRIVANESGIMDNELRNRFGLNGKKVLLTAARLVYRKGVDLVIEAMKKIKDQFPDLVYVILGDGPEKEKLEELVTCYALPVMFIGSVTNLEERAAWFSIADVYISTPRTLPYDIESFGLVYLEANLFGKPVIGSRSGGIPEAVIDGETGLLVSENDVHAIAAAVLRLFTDGALAQKLGEQGKDRVTNEFLWSNQSQKLAS